MGDSTAGQAGFLLLLALALLAPVTYGGITPLGNLVIELLAFASAAFAFLSPGSSALSPTRTRMTRIAVIATLLLGLLGLLQLVPLPAPLLGFLSPESARAWTDAASVLATFGAPSPGSPRISIAPSETRDTVLLLLAYLAAFLAAARLASGRIQRRILWGALVGSALLQVLLSVASQVTEERLHGPFVNPDHFAGWLEVALPIALALVWITAHEARRALTASSSRTETIERHAAAIGAAVLGWGVLAAGVGLTRSRGGILAATVATVAALALWVTAALKRDSKSQAINAIGWALLGLLFVAAAVGRAPLVRFLATDPRDIGSDTRVQLWTLSIEAWKKFPVLGSGLGTFREAFRIVQPRDFEGLVEQAHHDFLQLLVTGGAVGALLGLAAILPFVAYLASRWHRLARTEDRAFTLAALGALVSLLLHGLVEFNFSLPAVPVALALALGAAFAAIHDRSVPGMGL